MYPCSLVVSVCVEVRVVTLSGRAPCRWWPCDSGFDLSSAVPVSSVHKPFCSRRVQDASKTAIGVSARRLSRAEADLAPP